MNRLFLAPRRAGRGLLILLLTVVMLVTISGLALAQGGTPRKIRIGDSVTGTLDGQTLAQVYTFDAAAGDTVTVNVSTQSTGLSFGVLLTDQNGQILNQTADLTGTTVGFDNVALAATGAYYVTVIRGGTDQEGTFVLRLSGTSALAAPQPVTVQDLSVTLGWDSADDFNLEVRDPVGNAVNFRSPTAGGGTLSNNVNGGCANTVSQNATETISYPAGQLPGGSYEVIIYYNEACTQPSEARNFTLTVTRNGTATEPVRGSLRDGQQYVLAFVLSADGVSVLPGGDPVEAALNLSTLRSVILNPTGLDGNSATGVITNETPAQGWSFEGSANDVVTVNMTATSGSLDPFVVLVGPDGFPVATNDDATTETRNAQITAKVLPSAGRYVIVATRFGLQIGGTEGGYGLTLTRASEVAAGTVVPTAVAVTTQGTSVPNDANNDGLPDGSIEVLLTWNTRADMRLLIRDPQGRVVFSDRPAPTDSGVLAAQGNFNCAETSTTPRSYAYWPTDRLTPGTYEVQTWVFNECGDQVQPVFRLVVRVRGQEVINVSDRPDFSLRRHHYVTSFTVDSAGAATKGEGGTFFSEFAQDFPAGAALLATAATLEYGRPLVGTVDAATPQALYSFEANAGDRVRVQMRATQGNLDCFLYLLDSNGRLIAVNDDVLSGTDTNSRIEQAISTAGRYTVVASRYGARFGGTSGGFEISLTLLGQGQ